MEGYIGTIGSKVTAEVKMVNIFEYQDYKFSYYGASRYIYTIDMASAIDADMAVINDDGTKDYVENDPDVIEMEQIPDNEPESPAEDVRSALFGGDGQ